MINKEKEMTLEQDLKQCKNPSINKAPDTLKRFEESGEKSFLKFLLDEK